LDFLSFSPLVPFSGKAMLCCVHQVSSALKLTPDLASTRPSRRSACSRDFILSSTLSTPSIVALIRFAAPIPPPDHAVPHAQATDTSETTPEVFAALMLAILDTVFCLWVFNSLARTMAVLRVRYAGYDMVAILISLLLPFRCPNGRRNAVKLQMYQRFRMMLTICVVG
jgi:hypothetical protein